MAAEAEIRVAGDEHLLIHGAVRIVADRAAFLHRLVREEERTFLRGVALRASLVGGFKRGARALNDFAFMRIVAIAASHLAREDRVGVGQAELTALVQMAGEAGLGRFIGINNRTLAAASLDVDRSGTVACFAADVRAFVVLKRNVAMSRAFEVTCLVFMTVSALVGTNIGGARHIRRGYDRSVDHDASYQDQSPDSDASEDYRGFSPTSF